ncbi:DUF4446 family protein [Patescibacteria group bacterium]
MTLPISTEELIIYALTGVSVLLILWIIRLEVKIKSIPSIKNNQNLNNQIGALQKSLRELGDFKNQAIEHFGVVDKELKNTIKGIETIRFNPYKGEGIGGNQSFATALIDNRGNGVIISSLYSREKVSVFAKPIKNWESEYELSEEEKEVLQRVKNSKK